MATAMKMAKKHWVQISKTTLCMYITLFCTFLNHRCTTETWKCLISCFFVDRNTRQQLSFPFLNFDTVLKNSTPKNIANIWRLKQDGIGVSDKVWGSANSLFKWHFHCFRRCCCLSFMGDTFFQALGLWKDRKICHGSLWKDLKGLNYRNRGIL